MEQALINGIPALLMGLIAWWIQSTTTKSARHLDNQLESLGRSIDEFRKELSANTATNTEAHGKIWDSHRMTTRELGERIARLEAAHENCPGRLQR